MGIKTKLAIFAFLVTDGILILYLILHDKTIAIFQPSGVIASQQKNLILFVGGLGLLVVTLTVFATFIIAYKYREDNSKAKYKPDWNKNIKLEFLRWGFLSAVIFLVAAITWVSAHNLDPYKPLQSNTKPIKVQVIALQWRWLFVYPEQNIATINYLAFPEKTPVNFELTADAPMNSFWIPQLGGQIYAMAGMSTKTHLMANTVGEFQGSDAEISGKGFADMKFMARSTTQKDFDTWVKSVQESSPPLTFEEYSRLSKPNTDSTVRYYTLSEKDLYNKIMMKYMEHSSPMSHLEM